MRLETLTAFTVRLSAVLAYGHLHSNVAMDAITRVYRYRRSLGAQ